MVTDKVYDRAMPIDINDKGEVFEPIDTEAQDINYTYLDKLFQEAIQNHAMTQEVLDKIEEMDNYVIKHFRIAFGNRIVMHMKKFVPIFVACGGDEESNNNNQPQTNNSSTQQEQSNNAKEKEVVITVDSWQEYFEITYGLKEEKDNFDKITYADSLVCSVKLKDKYASKLVNKKFEIDFEFEKSTYFWKANSSLSLYPWPMVA
jgi:hypothetical protein